MSAPFLEARDLRMILGGQEVLNIPHLAVEQGEVLAILGPNGSGKSTLVMVLALLLRPTSGRLSLAGESIDHRANPLPYRRCMAVVFQEPLLLATTVEENVATGLKYRGIKGEEIQRRCPLWLERFGIGPLARRSAQTLSSGEAQRVSLARAFAMQPQLLFLDEPFASLDAPTRYALVRDLKAVLAETGTTALLVTHDRDEALALADRVGVLLGGRLVQLDYPQVVFRAPVSEEVAGFIGVENVLPGKVVSQQKGLAWVAVEGHNLEVVSELEPGLSVLVCVRPEDVTLSRSHAGGTSSARNRLEGRISRIDDRGSQWRVAVECGFPLVALITRQSGQDMGLAAGTEVTAAFKATAAHLISRS
ncbi:MAG: ABC transporter ATP-binding protein [Chloroflexi bacterium]|nr:ABC transporter ATP-binding protein [Chloroflexota bacterium]